MKTKSSLQVRKRACATADLCTYEYRCHKCKPVSTVIRVVWHVQISPDKGGHFIYKGETYVKTHRWDFCHTDVAKVFRTTNWVIKTMSMILRMRKLKLQMEINNILLINNVKPNVLNSYLRSSSFSSIASTFLSN